jgi:hypothetical protein
MRAQSILSVIVFSLAAVAATAPAEAQSATTAARFVGSDGDWFNARNWSTGHVPDAATDVVLAAGAQVVIDPARGSAEVAIRDLTVVDGASLTTLPGTIIHTRDEHVGTGGQLVYRSSGAEGGSLVFDPPPACTSPFGCVVAPSRGLTLNPTPKSKRTIILQSSVTTQVGLGGLAPASLTQTRAGWTLAGGAGHYATLEAEEITLAGPLVVSLHYGFTPRSGDTFHVVTATRRLAGEFRGLPEGAPVGCTAENVGLYVSYQGHGVVLAARDTPPATCLLLPAINPAREAGRVR